VENSAQGAAAAAMVNEVNVMPMHQVKNIECYISLSGSAKAKNCESF
jgi:hypothetical protein